MTGKKNISYITLIPSPVHNTMHHWLYLLDMGIIEVHPSSDFSLEEEGGVMFPVVTHHAHQVELWLTSLLLCHPVKQLQREREKKSSVPPLSSSVFSLSWWRWCLSVCLLSHIPEAQAGSQGVNDILSKVWVVRVPNQADGDDLWTVQEDTSHPELLPTLTLRRRRMKSNNKYNSYIDVKQWRSWFLRNV